MAAVPVLAATALKIEVPEEMLGAYEEAARRGSVAMNGSIVASRKTRRMAEVSAAIPRGARYWTVPQFRRRYSCAV